MTTTTPYRSPVRQGRHGFPELLHAEWTKFRTVRGWIIGMIVAVLVTVALGLVTAGSSQSSCQSTGQNAGGGPGRSGGACTSAFALGPGGEPVMDSFYFVRQPLAGNGSITVRVTSLTGLIPTAAALQNPGQSNATKPGLLSWSKAGIIIKDGTSQGSAYAAMMVTGSNGVRMQWNYTQDTPGLSGAVGPKDPRWLRLTRSGDTVTGYDSADGTHWTRVGAATLTGLPSTVQAGLFAASPEDMAQTDSFGGGVTGSDIPTQATAAFDHVSRSGAWPASSWTGSYIGGDDGPGGGGYHQSVGQLSVTGSGDIAPIVAGPGGDGGSDLTIANYLVGTFAGLIAVIVIATMFMTAEYRRGLIRTTLAASPRRGRVLAAKAIVVGLAAFVAGLVGAAVAVIFGTEIAHSRGYSVFPVTGLTELRVIVGTAALIAVAAVLTLAVGTMVRRSAAAVTLAIVVIVLPYFLSVTSVLPAGDADWVLRITPAAAFALEQPITQYHQVIALYTPGTGFFPLAPWTGFAVLCGWAALALGLAAYLLRRRDA